MDNHENNTCCSSNVYDSYAKRQVYVAFVVAFAILGTVGNTLVIAAVTISKKLRHTTNMFVLNLSIADLLICTYVSPIQAVAVLSEDRWPLPDAFCTFAAFLYIVCLGCSVNSLACIAINRYVMVAKRKATYQKLFGRQRTLTAIVLIWVVPFLVALIPSAAGYVKFGFEPKFSTCSWVLCESSLWYSIVLVVSFIPIQFFLIFASYGMVFYHIRSHTKRVQHLGGPIEMPVQFRQAWQRPKCNGRHQIQVTKNLFCVVCAFVLCIIPYNVSLVTPNTDEFIPIAGIILLGNSCLNPMIYAAKHPHFRNVFRCIIRGKFAEIPDKISCPCFN